MARQKKNEIGALSRSEHTANFVDSFFVTQTFSKENFKVRRTRIFSKIQKNSFHLHVSFSVLTTTSGILILNFEEGSITTKNPSTLTSTKTLENAKNSFDLASNRRSEKRLYQNDEKTQHTTTPHDMLLSSTIFANGNYRCIAYASYRRGALERDGNCSKSMGNTHDGI